MYSTAFFFLSWLLLCNHCIFSMESIDINEEDKMLTIGQFCQSQGIKNCAPYIREFFSRLVKTRTDLYRNYTQYRKDKLIEINSLDKHNEQTIEKKPRDIKMVIVQIVDRNTSGYTAQLYKQTNQALTEYASLYNMDFLSFRGAIGKYLGYISLLLYLLIICIFNIIPHICVLIIYVFILHVTFLSLF